MYFTAFVLSALSGLAAAQTVHVVEVSDAAGKKIYSPDSLTANMGDMVQFQFLSGNHTVTQADFDNPCQPIGLHEAGVMGFNSGFMPVAAGMSSGMIPTYTVAINSTKPIWAYCAQMGHCQAGMVMVINEK